MAPRLALGTAPKREQGEAPPEPDALRAVSLLRILRHDNAAFLMATFGAVLFLIALVVWITGRAPAGRGRPPRVVSPQEARAELAFTGILMVSGGALASLRALWLRRLFRGGEPVQATVTQVATVKGYSRLRFAYRHGGVPCTLKRTIRRSPRAQGLTPGDTFTILVDPWNSRRVVLAELYERG
ncbi:MAG TPA: DUF3592 domain-containing protein [Planctomycetota bacterium]